MGQEDESVGAGGDRSVLSRSSSRRGNFAGKPVTLASLTQTFMQEVVTEVSLSKVHMILCIKPNDDNTCKDFDNYTVSRQLAPYDLQKVLRFYNSGM